jgi:hypothetical protein
MGVKSIARVPALGVTDALEINTRVLPALVKVIDLGNRRDPVSEDPVAKSRQMDPA